MIALHPSRFHRLMRCAASPSVEEQCPQDPEAAAETAAEGIVAHKCFLAFLETGEYPVVGAVLGEGLPPVTAEMLGGAALFLAQCAAMRPDFAADKWKSAYRWEFRQSLEYLGEGIPGVADAISYSGLGLDVLDFKFGYTPVEAVENWQLIAYASETVAGMSDAVRAGTRVRLVIVQPRDFGDPIKTWETTAEVLWRDYLPRLKARCAEARAPNPVATPTGEGCKDCSGRASCTALKSRSTEIAASLPAYGNVSTLSTQEASAMLAKMDESAAILNAYRSGLQEQVLYALKRGDRSDHFVLTPGRASLKWTLPDGVIGALYPQLMKDPEPLTPTQALAAKLIDPDTLSTITSRPPAAVKLAPATQLHSKIKEAFSHG